MNRTIVISSLSAILGLYASSVIAQEFECGAAEVNNSIIASDIEKQALVEQLNREAEEYTALHYGERAGGIKVIPIVFHVIHNYGSENLSKATILNALDQMNNEFRGQNVNISNIVSDFQGIFADSEIEFRLAKLDPQGNCTDGITRTVSELTYTAGENVKDLISWNTTRYLNVWVVNTLESGAGGYSYYPGNAPGQSNEGIVLRAGQLAGSLSHEAGHFLNLRHTWGNSNDNALASNCSDDDNVNDTPNTIGSEQECNLSQVSCGSLDNVQNFMDYSTCGRMFTQGQKARMNSALNSSAGSRNTLWLNSTLIATGTNDGFVNQCVPTIEFSLDEDQGCEGLEVEYFDNSWGADVDASWQWSWNFPGGTPSTSTELNPIVTYDEAGTYDATLTITTAAGSDSYTIQNAVSITPFGGGTTAPFVEGIEATTFPNNSDPQLVWTIEENSNPTWQRTGSTSFSGSSCARINLRSIPAGTINSLISPPIDMSNVSPENAEMTFRLAHAPRFTDSAERLRIYASKNCGVTWTLRYTKQGDQLTTTSGGFVNNTFIPTASEWREEVVNLSPMAGEEHVLIKFEALSDQENYLYIDDINIAPDANNNTGIGIHELELEMTVQPNPVNGFSMIAISSERNQNLDFELVDVLGRSLGMVSKQIGIGKNQIPLSEVATPTSSGIYFLLAHSLQGTATYKVVVE